MPIVAVWIYHLVQRRTRERGVRKRNATLYITIVLLAVWALVYLLARFSLDDLYLVPIAFFAAVVMVWQRSALFPFRARCARCGASLSASRIFLYDSNTCDACEPNLEKGETLL